MTGGPTFFGWTIPPIVYAMSYGVLSIGAAVFLVVVGRKHAPTARREPFRKPALIRATGVLLLCTAAVLVFSVDGTSSSPKSPPAWAVALQIGLGVAGAALIFIGGRAYKRASAAYPPGKHADLDAPPDRGRRRRLLG